MAVDIDCCLFDRVLLFLEAHAACRAPPEYDIRLWPELGAAAAKLALRSLADAAAAHLGQFGARLREYTLDELRRRNAAGEVLICVDGMVLDVTRWLPEHPGGSTIIPAQATNVDATTFFGACARLSPPSAAITACAAGSRLGAAPPHRARRAVPRQQGVVPVHSVVLRRRALR